MFFSGHLGDRVELRMFLTIGEQHEPAAKLACQLGAVKRCKHESARPCASSAHAQQRSAMSAAGSSSGCAALLLLPAQGSYWLLLRGCLRLLPASIG
jgi:hypothetical protein